MSNDQSVARRTCGRPYRVGVTGHRSARLTSDVMQWLPKTLASILIGFGDGRHLNYFGGDPIVLDHLAPLHIVTSLADGADTLLAEVAIAQGLPLELILPFPEEYILCDLSPPDRSRLVNVLASGTIVWRETIGRASAYLDRAGRASFYLAAGRRVLEHSNLLLAIWDGQPARGPGGTGQIVGEAIRQGVPVLWIALDGVVRIYSRGSTEGAQKACWEVICL